MIRHASPYTRATLAAYNDGCPCTPCRKTYLEYLAACREQERHEQRTLRARRRTETMPYEERTRIEQAIALHGTVTAAANHLRLPESRVAAVLEMMEAVE